MLLSLDRFLNLSLKINPQFPPEQLKNLYAELVIKSSYLKIKNLIKLIRSYLPLSQQSTYEYLAKLSGEKNWNIASAKGIDFSDLFCSGIKRIPSLIPFLDEDLAGGFPRGGITTIIGGANRGKTLLSVSFACSALRQGFKVLHINLEAPGRKIYAQYASNLNNINYGEIIKENSELIPDKYLGRYNDNLVIISLDEDIRTVEDLIKTATKIRTNFAFELVVVDSPQLLDSEREYQGHRARMLNVYTDLRSLSQEFNCAILAPAQSTQVVSKKEDKLEFLTPEDVSETVQIRDISSVILTLNRRPTSLTIDLCLYKNQYGKVNYNTYVLEPDFNKCNLSKSGV